MVPPGIILEQWSVWAVDDRVLPEPADIGSPSAFGLFSLPFILIKFGLMP